MSPSLSSRWMFAGKSVTDDTLMASRAASAPGQNGTRMSPGANALRLAKSFVTRRAGYNGIVKIPQKTGDVLPEFRGTNRMPADGVLSPSRGARFQRACAKCSEEIDGHVENVPHER